MIANNISAINLNTYGKRKFSDNNLHSKKHIHFGYSPKSGLIKKGADFFVNGLDNLLKKPDTVGQFASNVINYGGKLILAPLMIFAGSKLTDEDNDSIKSSMLLEPVDAVISFGMATAFGLAANKIIGKAAELGKLGEFYTKKAHIKELKNISTLAMTALAIPVSAKLLSWALPKIKTRVVGVEIDGKLHADMYATKLNHYGVFAESLRPMFGTLTGGGKKHD